MAEEQPLDDDLESFAAALTGLIVSPSRLDRERLTNEVIRAETLVMLSASRASLRLWKFSACLFMLMAATFAGLWLASISGQQGIERIAAQHFDREATPHVAIEQVEGIDLRSPTETLSHDFGYSYITQRNLALANGVENLPDLSTVGSTRSPTVTRQEELKSLLEFSL